jgi:methyl-accepting chemotaxis protein
MAAAEATRVRAIGLSSSLLAVMTLLAGGTAVLLSRSIARQIGGEPDEACAVAHQIAEGNLKVDVRVRDGDQHSLMAEMRAMRESLIGMVDEVRHGVDAVATASTQIAQGNAELSSRTEMQASSLEETAASMEQMASTVHSSSDNARLASQLATSTAEIAVRGGDAVSHAVATMSEIQQSSRRISEIISVIDGIAFQTNILALNAAVEAARAGEQGRGFAVVASEVRSLAQRSATAAREIKTLIGESVEKIDAGNTVVSQAGETMGEVVSQVRRVADLIAEVTSSSVEQTQGIEQVNQAVGELDQATQQNAALVEQTAAATGSLRQQAAALASAMAAFKV